MAASPPAPASPVVEVVIPHPGPATFRSGWAQGWALTWAHARRPFPALRLWLAAFVAFTLARMALIYMVSLAAWGPTPPDPGTQQLVHAAFWQVFGFFLAPALITPFLAARVLLAHDLPVSWRLLAEPFRAPWRWPNLVGLGLAWVLVAGVLAANAPAALAAGGPLPVAIALVLAWVGTQVVFATATAAQWRDGLPFHRALGRGLLASARAWRPLAGLLASLVLQALALLAIVFVAVLLPLGPTLALGGGRLWLGVGLLALAALVLPLWHHHRAALALSVLDWSPPAPSSPRL